MAEIPDERNFALLDEESDPDGFKPGMPPEVIGRHRYLVRYKENPDGSQEVCERIDLHLEKKHPLPPSTALWVQVSKPLTHGDLPS